MNKTESMVACTPVQDQETAAGQPVVLAYSGGLDTSVAIKWLNDTYHSDVIATVIDVGQPSGELKEAVEKAYKIGATKVHCIDVKKEFITDYVFPLLKANALYEGVYPLATAAARPLIAKKLVETAKEEGAGFIAHGCTGKGNDQVRFEVGIMAKGPEMKIIATARQWQISREEAIDYAVEHGLPIPITKKSPYSIDENLWGRSIECGSLEDPWLEPGDDVFQWTKDAEDTLDEPLYVDIEFEKGIPVKVGGQNYGPVEMVEKMNELGGNYGIGRIDMIENRLVGIKSHEIYEAPGAEVLITAHKALEALTLTREQMHFKTGIEQKIAEMCYNGIWFDPLMDALFAFVDSTQKNVSGTVKVKLYKGKATVVGRKSKHSLYDKGLATYDESDTFDHDLAKGFIELWGLPVKVASLVNSKEA